MAFRVMGAPAGHPGGYSMTLKEFLKTNEVKTLVFNLRDWPWSAKQLNKLRFPRYVVKMNEDGCKLTNELLELLETDYPDHYKHLSRTKSNGISTYSNFGWDVDSNKSGIEIIFFGKIDDDIVGFRWMCGATGTLTKEEGITGRGSYFQMIEEFKKDGINIKSYAVDNGEQIKEEINEPLIDCDINIADQDINQAIILDHVNHIDLHSAYPSGMCEAYPELKPTCERIYNNRKLSDNDRKLKLQMDAAIGYFQSKYCGINGHGYALAILSKAGVNWCRETVEKITAELKAQGKWVIAHNTDGIWYQDETNDFHSDWIGEGLSKAAIDHKNCKIRFKSAGAYEYIENGKYTPVVRGSTTLDRTKPRTEWEWGDIFNAKLIEYKFNEETLQLELIKEI